MGRPKAQRCRSLVQHDRLIALHDRCEQWPHDRPPIDCDRPIVAQTTDLSLALRDRSIVRIRRSRVTNVWYVRSELLPIHETGNMNTRGHSLKLKKRSFKLKRWKKTFLESELWTRVWTYRNSVKMSWVRTIRLPSFVALADSHK